MKKTLVSILLLFFLLSCKEKQIVESENNANVNSFFPAKIGNYWIYLDSVTVNNVLEVSKDTVTIVDTEIADNQKWWKLNHSCSALHPIGKDFLIRNDSGLGVQATFVDREYNEFNISSQNYILYEENVGLGTNTSKFIQGIGVVKYVNEGTVTGSDPFKIVSTLIAYKND